MTGVVGIDERYPAAKKNWDYYLEWGGMPALVQRDFTLEDRRMWLEDYFATYLQRDLSDLARLNDLEPFVRAQQAIALRTSKTVNYSELGRLAGVTSPTAKRFVRYLEISYMVLQVPAFYRNPEKRLSKQPKIVFLDPGVRSGTLRKRGMIDGKEVDLLVECEEGFIAVECKMAQRIVAMDFRAIKSLPVILDKPLLAGLVVCQEDCVRQWDWDFPLYSVPAAWLLS